MSFGRTTGSVGTAGEPELSATDEPTPAGPVGESDPIDGEPGAVVAGEPETVGTAGELESAAADGASAASEPEPDAAGSGATGESGSGAVVESSDTAGDTAGPTGKSGSDAAGKPTTAGRSRPGAASESADADASADAIIAPAYFVHRNLRYVHRVREAWVSPSGAYVTGDTSAGVPFGPADRLVFIYYATRASTAGDTFVGKPADVAAMFDVSAMDDRTVAESLERVAFSRFQPPARDHWCDCGCRPFTERTAVAAAFTYCRRTGQFRIKLSPAFMDECRAGIALDRAAVAQLASNPAALDLYVWLRLRYQLHDTATLPLHGRGSVSEMLTGAKARHKVRFHFMERLALVYRAWRECPYTYDQTQRVLHCDLTLLRTNPLRTPDRAPAPQTAAQPPEVAQPALSGHRGADQPHPRSRAPSLPPVPSDPHAAELLHALGLLDLPPDHRPARGPIKPAALRDALGAWYEPMAQALNQGGKQFDRSLSAWKAAFDATAKVFPDPPSRPRHPRARAQRKPQSHAETRAKPKRPAESGDPSDSAKRSAPLETVTPTGEFPAVGDDVREP